MSAEMICKPSEFDLLEEKLDKLEGKTKQDFIEAEKGKITESYWKLPSSAQMVRSSKKMIILNKEQILTKDPETDPYTAYIYAHIEEAKRISIKLKQFQPRDIRGEWPIADNIKIEVEKINPVKNYIGIQIEKLRAPLSKCPSLVERVDPKLLRKLHLQPRK